jgi:micrococcal nuclease
MRSFAILAFGSMLWPAMACATPLPDCAGDIAIAKAQVVRIDKDGTLTLRDGRAVVLEGLRSPDADQPETPFAAQSLQALRQVVMAAPLILSTTSPQQDRYGRLRVQAFDHVWLQIALLERGLAWAQITPDQQECAPDLYEAEGRARAASLGLWALPQYRVRQTISLTPDLAGSFQLVEGEQCEHP